MNIIERKEGFKLELEALLKKFDCELCIEDFGWNYEVDDKIVVDFNWSSWDLEGLPDIDEETQSRQLVLGKWVAG